MFRRKVHSPIQIEEEDERYNYLSEIKRIGLDDVRALIDLRCEVLFDTSSNSFVESVLFEC